MSAELLEPRRAVEAGQGHVQQHEVGRGQWDLGDGFEAVHMLGHVVKVAQQDLEEEAVVRIVLDDSLSAATLDALCSRRDNAVVQAAVFMGECCFVEAEVVAVLVQSAISLLAVGCGGCPAAGRRAVRHRRSQVLGNARQYVRH